MIVKYKIILWIRMILGLATGALLFHYLNITTGFLAIGIAVPLGIGMLITFVFERYKITGLFIIFGMIAMFVYQYVTFLTT